MSAIRKILNFFSFDGALKKAGKIPRSAGYLQPGDVVTFQYKNYNNLSVDQVVVLVVATKAGRGVRVAKTGNKLITCFKLPGDGLVTREILKRLYKDRSEATFLSASRTFGGLKALLGPDNFRTYILNQVYDMHELLIDKGEL